MKCPEVVEWMHRYLDYDLSEEETVQLYDHLKQCPECAETFRMLKSLSRDLEDLPKVTPKFSIVDAIMPQLDAIDQARQEKSASREEPPAEMVPVPVRPVRTSKFRNSVAGRTAMGAVAAVIILGVAIYSYSPKHLSTAEEPAFKASQKMDTAASTGSDATQGSSQSIVEQKQAENNAGDLKQQDSADGSLQESGSAELTAPAISSDAAASKEPAKAADQPASKPQDKASTRSAGSEPEKQNPDKGKTDTGAPAKAYITDQTAPPENDGSSQDKKITADSSNTTEPPASDSKNNEQDPALKDGSVSMGMNSIKAATTQVNSPDGKYAATVEDNKLTIYSVSDKDGQKTAVKTIDLTGTWVSGVWSADSTVFTYQTADDQGATTSKTYQVAGSDASNP